MATPKHSPIVVAARAGAAATPEHKRFHQLVAKIERARALLAAWREAEPRFAQAHAARVRPLVDELGAARRRLAQRMDAMSAEPVWTKTERRTLAELVCEVAGALVDAGLDDEAGTMKALFDRHADVDYDGDQDARLRSMKSFMEEGAGIDLGDDEAPEDILRRAHERLREEFGAPPKPASKRKTAAQARREADALAATQSLREVFRKLASALHPDRSADAEDHARRTTLMQRVNQAYGAGDLLTLLALQLEIEQIDDAHLAGAPVQRMRHFNRVLADQLGEVEAEIDLRAQDFCARYGYLPERRPEPAVIGRWIESECAEIRAALAAVERDRVALDARDTAKRWLARQRRALRESCFGGGLF